MTQYFRLLSQLQYDRLIRIRDSALPSLSVAVTLFFGFFTPAVILIHYLGADTPIWVSNAVSVTILLHSRKAVWPALLAVQLCADFSASVIGGNSVLLSAGVVGCDVIEVSLVAFGLVRITNTSALFSSLEQISRFALVCVVVPVISSFIGSLLLLIENGYPFFADWVNWYLASVFGLLIIAPFLLTWTDKDQRAALQVHGKVEVIILALLVGAVGWIDFSVPGIPGIFLSFPFLLLAAFREGLPGATSAGIVLTGVASWATLHHLGPLASGPNRSLSESLLLLQLYLAVVMLSTLPVAVLLEQRKLLSAAATLAELSSMARHDNLTGLANRMLFQERVAWTQAFANRHGGQTALVLFDLDRFKPVNDLHGHAAGDQLLKLVADRVCAIARESDTVARLGGDEFAIVGYVEDPEAIEQLAQRVLVALNQPFEFSGLSVQIGCSIGITFGPPAGTDNDLLIQRADAALYRAKTEGRNRVRFFEPGMDVALKERAEFEEKTRLAIVRDELVPFYQPVVALGTGSIAGFEMLARWTHPELGEISPTKFIAVAESTGLIGTLTEQLLRRACHEALTWPNHLFVAVNISPVQLRDRRLPGLIKSILAETGLPASRLEIELTETALIDDFNIARDILVDLKAAGVLLALDDFGTGYSSLSHLQSLPLDKIKIDKGFVGSMLSVVASRKIVAGVIGLGHSLGLPIVAEGIEDASVAEALKLMGCDLGQGWHYGHGLPSDQVKLLLSVAVPVEDPTLKSGNRLRIIDAFRDN